MHQQKPTLVVMEACGSSSYWARTFLQMGHEVRLVPAQHVKPFVRGNKNDRNDALAIYEASQRPNMNFVAIKTREQRDIQMLHRTRQLYIKYKTAVSNQLRAFLSECGLTIPKQIHNLYKKVPDILSDEQNELTPMARDIIQDQYSELLELKDKIDALDEQIILNNNNNPVCQQLQKIPGIGPLIASALYASAGNGSQFSKGRQMSAWIGLTPAHFGTGGKNTNVSTSKKGDQYLRTLLIHGARTVVTWSARKTDPLSLWIQSLVARRGKRKAYVALANKIARVAWCILQGQTYQASKISVPIGAN